MDDFTLVYDEVPGVCVEKRFALRQCLDSSRCLEGVEERILGSNDRQHWHFQRGQGVVGENRQPISSWSHVLLNEREIVPELTNLGRHVRGYAHEDGLSEFPPAPSPTIFSSRSLNRIPIF